MIADDETFLLLNAYHDGELSPGETLAMERRLAADPALRALSERLGALSGAVRNAVVTPAAPPSLRARVIQQVGFADAAPRRSLRQSLMPLAATLLLGLVGGGLIGSGATYLGVAPGVDQTADAVLAGHLRGLIAPLPYDIASSNRHVVKPWFNGRTTVAPPTPDFAQQGFPLAGGRVDVVDGKPVPTLVYRHDQHLISVTIVPRTKTGASAVEHRGGSTIARWDAGDLSYWAVSDLDAGELHRFEELFRAQIAPDG